jgi:hypothetical protein
MAEKCKLTILPTKNWLIPLSILDTESTNKLLLADLIDEGKVIVRISKLKKMLEIYKNIENLKIKNLLLNQSKFIVKTYCTFECDENKISLLNNYKGDDSICNTTQETNKEKIMVEVMKKMKNTIQYMKDKLNLEQCKKIIKYLLFMTLHLFNEFGFIHNDIHPGNIFINIHKKDHKQKFIINNKKYKIIDKIELFLGDTEDSIIYSKPIFNYIKKDNEYLFIRTLRTNILQIFSCALYLLENKEIVSYESSKKLYEKEFNNLISNYIESSDYDEFIKNSLNYGIQFSNKLFIIIFNESFIEL